MEEASESESVASLSGIEPPMLWRADLTKPYQWRVPKDPIVIGSNRQANSRRDRLLLCDRDGVIMEDRAPFVRDASDVVLFPSAVEALHDAQEQFIIVIVSNQSAIGRGKISVDDAVRLHWLVLDRLSEAGVSVDCSYLCPHSAAAGCDCRKPAPGMVNAALAQFDIVPRHAIFVGDSVEDMCAAAQAGVRPVLVRTGRGAVQEANVLAHPAVADVRVVADLAEATSLLRDMRS